VIFVACYKVAISDTLFNNSLQVIFVACYKVTISDTLFNNSLQVIVVACYKVTISDTIQQFATIDRCNELLNSVKEIVTL
jgi:hypothetical protein